MKSMAGQMAECLTYDYEKDYILEAMMQDKVIQEKKARKKSFDLRKTTKAHEATILNTKKRLQQIAMKEASN